MTLGDVCQKISDMLDVPPARLEPQTVLTDLVSDSFRLVELAIELQEDFDVVFGQEDLRKVVTVADLAALLESRDLISHDSSVNPGRELIELN